MLKRILKKGMILTLEWEARAVLRKYKPKIIAITGSVGKTSTKDAVYEVIASKYHARKSKKSYNSELGVPLAVLDLESGWNNPITWIMNCARGLLLVILKNHYPTWLVLEVGVDRPGDMARITRWLTPDVVIITRFADIPPHIEFFENPQEIYEEKWKLALALKKEGILIINSDDAELLTYSKKHPEIKTLTFGFSPEAYLRAEDIHVTYQRNKKPKGLTFKAVAEGNEVPINLLGTVGHGHVYAALAALSCGKELDINLVVAAEALTKMEPVSGRMRLLAGVNESTIIDDSYNASPDALSLSLSAFYHILGEGRKILVLGDMLELGKFTHEAHTRVGTYLSKDLALLVLVGPRARFVVHESKGSLRENQIVFFDTALEAGEYLQKKIKQGDIILVKGSQGIRLEKAIKKILANQDDARLLVRQGKEWEKR